MAIAINGDGTITGISVGGLPDGVVDAGTLATNSVDSAELIDGAVDDSHMAAMAASKLTGALPATLANDVIVQKYTDNYTTSSPSASDTSAFTVTFTGLTASTEYLFLIGASWGLTGDNTTGSTVQCICTVKHGATTIYTSHGTSVATAQETSVSFNVVPYNYTTGGAETSIDFTFYVRVSNASVVDNMFCNKAGHTGGTGLENFITAIKV